MAEINSETKLVGLIGNPVKHSLSPVIQNRAFQVSGLNLAYFTFKVEPHDLEQAIEGMAALGLAGFNVTIPFKETVLPFLDILEPEVKMIGAANTVVIQDGKLRGWNTDGLGFIRSLEEKGINPAGQNILLIGAGGAAKAVSVALALQGAKSIIVANRSLSRGQQLSEKLSAMGVSSLAIPLEQLTTKIDFQNLDLVVNATPVGMHSTQEAHLIPVNLLSRSAVVCDLVYGSRRSWLLQEASGRGCTALDGSGMLLHQGAEAFQLFTGVKPPIDDMREALDVVLCQNM